MQAEEVNSYIEQAEELMNQAIEHLHKELVNIRTGKAAPAMLQSIMVSYYGTPTPLHQVANVSASDGRTLVIQPWEKSMVGPIERAIFEANLGLTPQNDGELIRISIPPFTEERRKELVKRIKALGEDAKVSVRNARRDGMEHIKKAVKDGYPEDTAKRKEAEVQDLTKQYSDKIDKMIEAKEKDILTV